MKQLILFILLFHSLTAVCQYELDAAESCQMEIEKNLDNVLIAYGSPECTIFTLDTIIDDYTLLVFDKKLKSELLYQVTVISGQKEGLEIFFINNEKVIVHYIEGIKTGISKTFYPSGKVHYIREYRNGILRKNVREYDERGKLIRTIKIKK